MNQAKAVVKRALKNKIDRPATYTGLMGNGLGAVLVPGRPGFVYARIDGRDEVYEVFDATVPAVNDLPVLLGNDLRDPSKFTIVGARKIEGQASLPSGSIAPAARYRWMASGGGQDPLFVELRQIMPLRPTPVGGMVLQVYRGWVGPTADAAPIAFDTDTVDLTSSIPAGAGDGCFVLVTISTAAAIVVTKGAEMAVLTLTGNDIPVVPADTAHVIAAVRLYNGMTAINETRSNTDLIDLRFSTATGGGAAGVEGIRFDEISFWDNSAGEFAYYAATTAGLTSAVAAADNFDVIYLPSHATFTDVALTMPSGKAFAIIGGGSRRTLQGGTPGASLQNTSGSAVLTFNGGNVYLRNLRIYVACAIAGNAVGIDANDNYGALEDVNVWVNNSGAGNGYAILDGYQVQCMGGVVLGGTVAGAITSTPYSPNPPVGNFEVRYPDTTSTRFIANGLLLPYHTPDVSNPPTDAELDTEFGTPATVGAGFTALVNDAGGGTAEYLVWSDGANWFFSAGTKAT